MSDRLKLVLSVLFFFLVTSVSLKPVSAANYTMQLHQVRLPDLARVVYGDALHFNYILDDEFLTTLDQVSLNWLKLNKMQLQNLTTDLIQLRGFEVVKQGTVFLIRKRKKEDEELLVFRPRNRSARYLSDIIAKVADVQPLGTRGMTASPEFQQAVQKQPEQSQSAGSMISQGASDQLAYECMPAQCLRLKKLLFDLDTPEAQVVLRAAVYEVGTTQGQGSAIQIAAKLFQGKLQLTAGSTIPGVQIHMLGDLDAVLSVLDQDSRFKSISKPMLRVKTGAQAKFSVGQQVPILGSMSQDKNGNAIQSVEYRQSGTIFTVQPDVRDDLVDINITQELSSFVATTTGVNGSPTLLQRMATSQLTIRPGEVVVFAGLEEVKDDEADSRLFGFSLGKKKNQTTSEVLLFIEAQRI